MPVKVRLLGPQPTIEPGPLQEGLYELDLRGEAVIRDLLPRFGLEEPGLSFFLNGRPAGMETRLEDGDELDMILMVMGG